jgi:uncharacterized membrane protein YgcG
MKAGIKANMLRKPRKNWPNLPLFTKIEISRIENCYPVTLFRREERKNFMKQTTQIRQKRLSLTITALGLSGLVTGCATQNPLMSPVNAQAPIVPTASATPNLPSPTPQMTATPSPSPTPSPTFTPWPTATQAATATVWPTPAAWQPTSLTLPALPTLAPVPVVAMPAAAVGVLPVGYSPPDGVDVFGGTILRWEYVGGLAEDEWFDVKIKPHGSNDSAFVDWTKSKEYPLTTWSGWTPGLYTWQIGIVKGSKIGETRHFVADLGRDSQSFLIKWQPGGSGGGGGSASGGGSSSGGSSGGGGGTSGGS